MRFEEEECPHHSSNPTGMGRGDFQSIECGQLLFWGRANPPGDNWLTEEEITAQPMYLLDTHAARYLLFLIQENSLCLVKEHRFLHK